MAYYYPDPSHTFSEYLLVPGYTSEECVPDRVSLKTPLVKYRKGQEDCPISLNIPMVSAIMQSVSNDTLAIALAKEGGLSFIFGSQSIESEAEMVRRVKSNKAGFVPSASNLTSEHTLADVLALKEKNGFSTVAITEDATPNGKLLGIVTSRDYRVSRMSTDLKVREFMTPREKLVTAPASTTLKEANDIIWEHKLNALPIVDENDHLLYFVFRKDYAEHKEHPLALQDDKKRYLVGAGINSRDYAERIPALVEAGADVLCIDSSEGYSVWQKKVIDYVRANYGNTIKIGAGNVVDRDGFRFLAESGADFVKVGIGAEKKSRVISDKEKKITAYHESGHAILFHVLPDMDPVYTISIIPTGMGAAGYTMPLPDNDEMFNTKGKMLQDIMTLLGGRIAEEIIFGDITTGASNDIKRATATARSMVMKYGMSDKLGLICYGDDDDEVFIGRDLAHTRSYSEDVAKSIDEEIRRIISECHDQAKKIILEHEDVLHKCASLLLEKEKVHRDEFEALFTTENPETENNSI